MKHLILEKSIVYKNNEKHLLYLNLDLESKFAKNVFAVDKCRTIGSNNFFAVDNCSNILWGKIYSYKKDEQNLVDHSANAKRRSSRPILGAQKANWNFFREEVSQPGKK